MKILIAEDDLMSLAYFNNILKRIDCTIIHANSGKAAVGIVAMRDDITCVFMDIKLPIMDGIEATKLIKKIRPNLPVIALTAFAFNEERQKIMSSGCDDCISKPYQINEIIEIVKKLETKLYRN